MSPGRPGAQARAARPSRRGGRGRASGRRVPGCLLVASFALAAPIVSGPAFAEARWEKGDAFFELSGSLRELGLYSKQTDVNDFLAAGEADVAQGNFRCVQAAGFDECPSFEVVNEAPSGQSLTRLRIEARMRATRWLSAEVIYDNDVIAGSLDTLEADLAQSLSDQSFIGAEGTIVEGDAVRWEQQLYRAWARFEAGPFELDVGRMRVAWGVGRLWNPIDRFSALPPLALQPDVTPGIDGLDARWAINGFSYLQLVFAPTRDMDDMRLAGRVHGVLLDTDLSLMAGVFEQAPTAGFDLARNLGEAAMGAEVVYTHPAREVWKIGAAAPEVLDDFWQVDVHVDRTFDLGTGVYVLVEYLYNGNALGFGAGIAGPLLPLFEATDTPPPGIDPNVVPGPYVTPANGDIFGSSRVVTNAAHQIGAQLGYDLTPDLRGDFVTLVDLDGGSAAFFPNLLYSPLDWIEITLGAQFFAGPLHSQYGEQSILAYGRVDLFF